MHAREPLDFGLAVRAGRGHLVRSRPPHRTGDGLVSFDSISSIQKIRLIHRFLSMRFARHLLEAFAKLTA
jgi:hypothetical protein